MSSSVIESRRQFVLSVWEDRLSVSEACRRAGVSRKTGRKWLKRADDCGLYELAELSRAPKRVANRTCQEVEQKLLEAKDRYPEWAGRKLSPILLNESDIRLPSRTADRILKRNGKTRPAPERRCEPVRFERENCGALLQMDFKGLPRSARYALLTVLDDHSRYCLNFAPIPDKTAKSVQPALWELFGQYGLPHEMLMDNGDCWGSVLAKCPTRFETWLMRLGVKPIHGRPMHPETQGKVERFHLTAQNELAHLLIQDDPHNVASDCRRFVHRYNWVRPHDALGGKAPGSFFTHFPNRRPDSVPEHHIPEGATSRKVDINGFFLYRGKPYKVGKGLVREWIVLREDELGMRVFYAGFPLPYIHEL
jgi:transposase InsO family protein